MIIIIRMIIMVMMIVKIKKKIQKKLKKSKMITIRRTVVRQAGVYKERN